MTYLVWKNLQAWYSRDKPEWSQDSEGTEGLSIETLQLRGNISYQSGHWKFESVKVKLFSCISSFAKTCIVDKKISMNPIITMVKSRKFQVFWWTVEHIIHFSISAQNHGPKFFQTYFHLQISLIMLPQALGYDCREAFNGENHHENDLKVANLKI